jgi:hypothetical protein
VVSLRPIRRLFRRLRDATLGDANQCRAEQPFVIGIAGKKDLGDGPGGRIAALDLEQRLVTVGIERFDGRRLNLLDPVPHKDIP